MPNSSSLTVEEKDMLEFIGMVRALRHLFRDSDPESAIKAWYVSKEYNLFMCYPFLIRYPIQGFSESVKFPNLMLFLNGRAKWEEITKGNVIENLFGNGLKVLVLNEAMHERNEEALEKDLFPLGVDSFAPVCDYPELVRGLTQYKRLQDEMLPHTILEFINSKNLKGVVARDIFQNIR